jgi:biopolymer transport protein ExbB/TolQ
VSSPIQPDPANSQPPILPAAAPPPPPEELVERGGKDNLDMVKALFLGLMFTAVFYEIFPIPFLDQGRLLSLFQNDNWVSPVIVAMTFWSLFILAFKLWRFRFQNRVRQAFRHPAAAALLGRIVYARDVDRVVAGIKVALQGQRVRGFEHSIIYRRVLRLLHFVRSAPKKEGLDSLLDYQAQIDVKKLEASYTVLQVFIWAIPILGFIGTVLGIGFSVNEFAHFIQGAEAGAQFNAQMRAALGGVTSGLAVAFNTTFLALVLVIPVMLLTSFLHKNEEEFLLEIEEYCLEELLPRLHVNPGDEALAEGFEEHLHKILRLSHTWLSQFEPLVERLSREGEMTARQLEGIQPLIKDFTDRLLLRRAPAAAPPLPEPEPDEPFGEGGDPPRG